MYFWRIEKLKEDIRANRLTEKDRFIYALIYIAVSAAAMEVMLYIPLENTNGWDFINSLSNVLIATVGTLFAFKANGSGNGKDFLGKFLSIGFVVSIRFLVYMIPLMIALSVYYFFAFEEEDVIPSSVADVIPFLIWYVAIYWRLCVHIKQVNL
jgi:uncharacterized membrane-anchored protein YitT (DUF2179 family)